MRRNGLNSRFIRVMRTTPNGEVPNQGGGGAPVIPQGQQQGAGQQGAGGGGPPQQGQQGQQGGQPGGQAGQQGQQQQGQQDPYGNLFNQARQQGGQFDTGQQGQQQGAGQQQMGQLTADAVAQIVESAIDRRINLQNNPDGGRQRQQQNNQGGQGQQQQQQVPQVDQGARREARLAFREYVGDQIRFLSETERNAAVQIGTAMIATWDGQGNADEFGRQVSKQVAETITNLGEMYQRVAVEQLKKQGLLKEQPGTGPGAGSGSAAYSIPAGGAGFVLPNSSGGTQQRDPQAAITAATKAAAAYNEQAGWKPAVGQTAS